MSSAVDAKNEASNRRSQLWLKVLKEAAPAIRSEMEERMDCQIRCQLADEWQTEKRCFPKGQKCKDLHGTEATSALLKMMHFHGRKMGCFGDGTVDFDKMMQTTSGGVVHSEVALNRIREWLIAGMCIECQRKMFEDNY